MVASGAPCYFLRFLASVGKQNPVSNNFTTANRGRVKWGIIEMWIVVKEEVRGKKDHMEGMSPGDRNLNYDLFLALQKFSSFQCTVGPVRKDV